MVGLEVGAGSEVGTGVSVGTGVLVGKFIATITALLFASDAVFPPPFVYLLSLILYVPVPSY